MKKVLVTGIDGFVAPYLVNELLKKNYNVLGTYLEKCDITNIKTYKLNILKKEDVKLFLEKEKPDIIFHLAAISSVRFSLDNPDLTYKVNVVGTKNLLDFSKNINFILIGSSEEYGIPKSIPINETHPLNPNNPYSKSKVEIEKYAINLVKNNDYKIIILRSFNHIGPGQNTNFVVSSFAKQITDNSIIKVGNLDAKRDFTDVRDVVNAYVLASELCDFATPYNICSNNSYSIKTILDKLITLSHKDIKIITDKKRLRPSDIPIMQGDNSKFVKKTNWKPLINIDKSLIDILNYWKNT